MCMNRCTVDERMMSGLSNPSNYCYGNSLIQQLFQIPAFRDDILRLNSLDFSENIELLTTSTTVKKFDQPQKRELILQTLLALRDLFHQLVTSNEPQSIHDFYQSLILTLDLKPSVHGEMRDVSEFFSELMKILLLSTGKSLEISSPVLNLSTLALKEEERFLQDHLGGEFIYTIQPVPSRDTVDSTTISNLKIERKERFYYISLNLHHSSQPISSSKAGKKPVKLLDSLSSFFQSKSFNYKWKNPITSEMMSLPSSQTILINNLSNNVIFYLRRFQYDWKKQEKEKFFQPFLFSYSLDLTSFFSLTVSDSPIAHQNYRLNGLILHLGDTTEEGHYISLIYRDSGENVVNGEGNSWLIGSKWIQFDDDKVEEVIVEYEDEIYDEEAVGSKPCVRKIALEEIEENVVMLFYTKQ